MFSHVLKHRYVNTNDLDNLSVCNPTKTVTDQVHVPHFEEVVNAKGNDNGRTSVVWH